MERRLRPDHHALPRRSGALNALLTGEVEYAVLPEHPASVSLAKAQQQGKSLERTVDLQALWAEVTGGEARFPMAGLVMPSALTENSALVGAVLSELEAAVEDVNAMSEETVAAISSANDVPAPVVKEVIPRLQLKIVAAADAKSELEDFYTRLSTLNPDIIGGSLPAADFYVADPR